MLPRGPNSLFPRTVAGNPSFGHWARWVTRRTTLVLSLCSLLTLGFLALATQLRIDTSFKSMMVADPESARVLQTVQEKFGREDLFVVLVEGDVFSDAFLNRLTGLHRELETIDPELQSFGRPDRAAVADNPDAGEPTVVNGHGGKVVQRVTSLASVVVAVPEGTDLRVSALLDGYPKRRSLEAVRALALERRSVVGNFVGEAGLHAVLTVQTAFTDQDDTVRIYGAIQEVVARYQAADFRVSVTGAPGLGAEVYHLTLRDGVVVSGLSLLLMGALLLFTFRRPLGSVAPLLVVGQTVIWTAGAMALFDVPLTLLSAVTPTFIFCVGLGDSIHLQSVTQQKVADGMTSQAATVHAVEHVGKPVLFTSLTTAIGLASFQTSSLAAIRQFGVFSAFGVMVAMVLSLTMLPALLSRGALAQANARTKPLLSSHVLAQLLAGCNRLSRSTGGRRGVLLAAVLFSLICALGISQVRMEHYPLTWLPEESAARTAIEALDRHVGGAADFTLLVERPQGGDVRELALLQQLEGLERDLLAYRDPDGHGQVVKGTVGLLDLLRETWAALSGGTPTDAELPPDQRCVYDTFTVIEAGAPSFLRRFITTDHDVAVMYARTAWLDDGAFQNLIAHIQSRVAARFGPDVRVGLAGAVYDAAASGMVVLPDLVSSFGVAFLVITALMVAALGDVRLGVLAMVPNLLPILAVVGFMGAAGIRLDLSTLVVASVGIGIVVDDTIHFLFHFKTHYRRSADVDASVEQAFRRAGPAMIQTSVVLVAGFLVCLAAELNNIRMFGLLVAVTVVVALLVDLVFVPALLRSVYPSRRAARDTAPLVFREHLSGE